MRKHCGNCANYKKEKNKFSEECGKCVSARLENGETTDPSHWRALPQTNADRMSMMLRENDANGLLDLWQEIFEDGVPSEDYFKWWLKQPAEEETQPDCTYNENGHCIGQKLMPECDAKNCDRRIER